MEEDTSTASATSSGSEVIQELKLYDGSDSSFYGNTELKSKYERKAARYDANSYWRIHDWNVQVVAARAVNRSPEQWPTAIKRRKLEESKREKGSAAAIETTELVGSSVLSKSSLETSNTSNAILPYNPYEGETNALQLDEPVSAFLQRLPPSTTQIHYPWIYVANFDSQRRTLDENISGFRQLGMGVLNEYLSKKAELESTHPDKPPGAITRMLAPDRKIVETDIINLAKKHGVTGGKWMLFPSPKYVDEIWGTVVRGTTNGRLGFAAKVATSLGNMSSDFNGRRSSDSGSVAGSSMSRLICIYTADFSDVQEVKRVLLQMKELRLLDAAAQGEGRSGVYYKIDAYTHLDISSGNEFKLKASMYSSKDLLAEMKLRGEI